MRIDNCPYDILALICDRIHYPHDRASVALTSSSLYAAVLPQLYSAIHFGRSQAVAYKRQVNAILSPFEVILSRKELARYVKTIDVSYTPPSNVRKLDDVFFEELHQVLGICHNLRDVHFTVNSSTSSGKLPTSCV
ncbi:hypothetical protein DL93DRAFT_923189 [Clavulina sp. PMI_390]|nr:hypothetical protein DL93DRAFT_923189 [Clavulina sp. PMI_390]